MRTGAMTGPPILCVFDFDHTIMELNTDVVVQTIPGRSGPIPRAEQRELRRGGWTQFMDRVFDYHWQRGVRRSDYEAVLAAMSFAPGMAELVLRLKRELAAEIIIISDSNAFFIEHILATHGLSASVDRVFTNPAHFDERGCLRIRPCQEQSHCPFSPRNMCKGDILTDYRQARQDQGVAFPCVAYAGDGTNDFSAMLQLQTSDLAFPRAGDYAIGPYMARVQQERGLAVQAQVIAWTDGSDIWRGVAQRLQIDSGP